MKSRSLVLWSCVYVVMAAVNTPTVEVSSDTPHYAPTVTAVEPPVNYPGLLHFRCGHGIALCGDEVGPSVWMVMTDNDRGQLGVSMQPADAATIVGALGDSAGRAFSMLGGPHRRVGGYVETLLRQSLERLTKASSLITTEQVEDNGPGYEVDVVCEQLRWLLGEGT